MTKDNVGKYAGEIWQLLFHRGKLNLRDIGEATSYRQDVIFLSLGWLLRENKIEIIDRNGVLYYALKFREEEVYA